MIENQKQTSEEHLRSVGLQMMDAARTAPKARGLDYLEIQMITGEDRIALADTMEQMAESGEAPAFFGRDGKNLREAGAVILIGTRYEAINLNCGWCGYPSCGEKQTASPGTPCFFNANDMGIAVGSAVSVAADARVDCRVMYSVGVAAQKAGLISGDCNAVLGIPISATAKSPFFDRQ